MSRMSIKDFLGHQAQAPRGAFLKNWKDKGSVTTWLHRNADILGLWRHQFPRLVPLEDKQTGAKRVEVWGHSYNCHETEDLLKIQFRRDPKDNSRVAPPEVCGFCKMLEHIYQGIDNGSIDWTQEVFRFEGAGNKNNPSGVVTLHAGGLVGAYNGNLTEEEKAELRAHKIFPSEAWKEKAQASLNYLFCVVDDSAPSAGVQVAIETSLLGDKVKTVIKDQLISRGEEEGDPSVNPYAIQWQHHPKESEFQKKYHAVALLKTQLTPEIDKLISGPPPDTDNLQEKFNAQSMRAIMEKHCLIDLPWDQFFGKSDGTTKPTVATPSVPGRKATSAVPVTAPKPKAAPTPEVEMVACDECGKEMPITASVCHHCGATYDVDPVAPEPPPPPVKVLPKRSAAAKKTPAPVAPPVAPSADEGDVNEDDIPF